LIKEVNDTIKCATELAALLEGKLCHVNLIPFNPVKGQNYAQSTLQRTKLFVDLLSKKGSIQP